MKCRKFFKANGSKALCFEFNAEHLERHLNMFEFTKTPIIIAVYQREEGTDNPIADSLIMMDILYMKRLVDEMKLSRHKRKNKIESYYTYQIPVKRAMEKFKLIEYYKTKK